MSILVEEYNKANNKKKQKHDLVQVIDVSLLDILAQSEVEVIVKDYKDCYCMESNNRNDYFIECKKCHGRGIVNINNHELICNVCDGNKLERIHTCYICNNENKVLKDTKINVKLNNKLKENDDIVIENDDYSLVLKINIFDIQDYCIKGNDVYKLSVVKYSKEDYKNKVNKKIRTLKGYEYIKSDFKKKKEIIKLDNKGINDGNFYFIFENEIENEKEIIYANVLIKDRGYLNIDELISQNVVIAKDSVALNDNSIYVDKEVKQVETDDYIINLNILNPDEFEVDNDNIYYLLNLEKQDLENDKKSIIVNGERINVGYKSNLKEVSYFKVNNRVLLDKQGKKMDLVIKIIPYFDNVYKISIKHNKDIVYVEDYKYQDYTLVESFKSEKYLDKYIKIGNEDKVYIDTDVILIKRV